MFDDLDDLYQQVIIDHSRKPRNFRVLEGANRTGQGRNPLCGDQVTLYMKLENDVIKDISFQGDGCAIFKASASMMTDNLKGKTKAEAGKMFESFRDMTTTGANRKEVLGKLGVFAGVNKFPARVKCAILPWHAVAAALDGQDGSVSTE